MATSQSYMSERPNKPPRTYNMASSHDNTVTQRRRSPAQNNGGNRKEIYTSNTMSSPRKMFTATQSIHHIEDEEVEEVPAASEPCSSV